jgi:hypothetical protein
MTTTASTTRVAAVRPTAAHTPREEEDAVVSAAAETFAPLAEALGAGVAAVLGCTLLSGGTKVPTGCTVGAALKPQSSSEDASR